MLKYVALMRIDKPDLWCQWHSGSTACYFKSPIFESSLEAEKWLQENLEKYPNSTVNTKIANKKYYIFTTIIAFDDKESKNINTFLDCMR